MKVRPEVRLVMLSVDEEPVSSASSKSRSVGESGTTLSMVIDKLEEEVDRLPAASRLGCDGIVAVSE